jgi:hypothetical protein
MNRNFEKNYFRRWAVGAVVYGTIKRGFKSYSTAYRFARKWESDNGYGRGLASVHSYEEGE